MEELIELDKELFAVINSGWASPWLDSWLPLMREATLWSPLYLLLLTFITMNFKVRGWKWFLFALLAVSLSASVSGILVKWNVERLRPCWDPAMEGMVRKTLGYCPTGYSFTSSHAANHFCLATFFYTTLKRLFPLAAIFFVWSATISLAQIYVGVHYPLDVLGGTLVGLICGGSLGMFFTRRIGLRTFDQL